jgi:hypothetical protein
MAHPGPPDDGRVPRRPGAHPERAPESDDLLCDRMPLRQQRFRIVHPPPVGLDPRRSTRPGRVGRSGGPARTTRSGGMPAAVLHAVDGERKAAVLQGPRDAVGSAGPPGQRGLAHALPTARQGPHRLPGVGAPTQARIAICGSMPPRPGHDHHRAGGRGLDDPVSHRRRCDVAARSHPAGVARAGRAERGELPTVLGLRPRRSRDPAWGTGWDVEYPRDIWRLHRLPGLTASPGKPTLPTPPPPARPEEPAIRKSWYRPADHACATARHPAAFQGNHVDDHAKSPIHGLRLRCAMYLATLSLIARQHA